MSKSNLNNPDNNRSHALYRHRLRRLHEYDQYLAEAMMLRNVALLDQEWDVEADAVRIMEGLRKQLRALERKVKAYHKRKGEN